jgi:hypothetical protein
MVGKLISIENLQDEKLMISTRIEQCSEDTRKLLDLSNFRITGDVNRFTVGGKFKLLQEIREPVKVNIIPREKMANASNHFVFSFPLIALRT